MRSPIGLPEVRRALLDSPDAVPTVVDEAGAAEQQRRTPAAVLVPLVQRADGLHVLLTQRTAHLKDHPGQISFPGGRVEPEDVSPLATALREAQEEIGLDPAVVSLLGYLPRYHTGTGFLVTPVVACITPPFATRADPFEVADVFEVPLDHLFDPSRHQRMAIHLGGRRRAFFSMPYENRFIWGATAGMLHVFFRRFASANPASS